MGECHTGVKSHSDEIFVAPGFKLGSGMSHDHRPRGDI
jgi:hypothetical protein